MEGHGSFIHVEGNTSARPAGGNLHPHPRRHPAENHFVGKFEGQFLQGDMDGLGQYVWPEGDTYVGEYARGLRHGTGTYTMIDQSCYKGQYTAGVRKGWGSWKNAQGGPVDVHDQIPTLTTRIFCR